MTPACTTAHRFARSSSRISSIRVSARDTPPCTGTGPPERLVAEPRAVTGTRASVQTLNTSWTSAVVAGSTASSGACVFSAAS